MRFSKNALARDSGKPEKRRVEPCSLCAAKAEVPTARNDAPALDRRWPLPALWPEDDQMCCAEFAELTAVPPKLLQRRAYLADFGEDLDVLIGQFHRNYCSALQVSSEPRTSMS